MDKGIVKPGQIWHKQDLYDHWCIISLVAVYSDTDQLWFGVKLETGEESNIWIYTDIDHLKSEK